MRQIDFIIGTLEALRPEVGLGALPFPSELLFDTEEQRAQREAIEAKRRALEAESRWMRESYLKKQEEMRPTRSAIRSREIRKRQKRK